MSENSERSALDNEPRHKAKLAVYYFANEQRNLMANYSVNISSGGVFLETVRILPVDTMLIVKFKLPHTDPIITCNARVAWTNEPEGLSKFNLPPGMGLQFLDLPPENLRVIRDFLNKGDLTPTW